MNVFESLKILSSQEDKDLKIIKGQILYTPNVCNAEKQPIHPGIFQYFLLNKLIELDNDKGKFVPSEFLKKVNNKTDENLFVIAKHNNIITTLKVISKDWSIRESGLLTTMSLGFIVESNENKDHYTYKPLDDVVDVILSKKPKITINEKELQTRYSLSNEILNQLSEDDTKIVKISGNFVLNGSILEYEKVKYAILTGVVNLVENSSISKSEYVLTKKI